MTTERLLGILRRIDGRGYKAWQDIRGQFELDGCTLYVDHVQGDPFAAPSKMRVRVAQSRARFPAALYEGSVRRMALADYLARRVRDACRAQSGRRGSGKSGAIFVDAGAQEVLQRTAVVVGPEWVEARLEVGLPAAGRRVLGREGEQLLCTALPAVAADALVIDALPEPEMRGFVECVENQEAIRAALGERGLVAFVADGAILPRASGASDRPMSGEEVVPFESPAPLRVEMPLANPVDQRRSISGMGIPRGVTLIVGGGYHGKSTLLKALERGVYAHIPGDGREYVVTDAAAVKVRAEDGRRVEAVDIRPLIRELPGGRSTEAFRTDDASGSTSQAASILEAAEAGAQTLLIDEDTSATNLLVRDARMQALVAAEDEPITPLVDRIRQLADDRGVSSVLVMGGSGDYLDQADTVLAMRAYRCSEATEAARRVAAELPTGRERLAEPWPGDARPRVVAAESVDASRGRRAVKIDVRDLLRMRFGESDLDLRGVEQLLDSSQTRAVGYALHAAAERLFDGRASVAEVLDAVDRWLDERGLDELDPFHRPERHPGNFARPRRFEIAAALNRLRTLRVVA